MICAIHQPQFIPWLGYLQKVRRADVFVFLDVVQFRKNEFQNRNRIPTRSGVHWLTVPVRFDFGDTIRSVSVADDGPWRRKVWRTIEQGYHDAEAFARYGDGLKRVLDCAWPNLAEINAASVEWLLDCFEIRTKIVWASKLPEFQPHRTQRLVEICKHLGADTYLSGSQASCYLEVDRFNEAGIPVEFQDFNHPVYSQRAGNGEFVSHMSAIDGLFTCGGGEAGRAALNL
jgi:hypothetical protein